MHEFETEAQNLIEIIDLGEYEPDQTLLNGVQLLVQFKGFNRLERLNRQTSQILRGEAGSSTQRKVSDGAIIIFDRLSTDVSLDALAQIKRFDTQDSRGVAFHGENIYVGCIDAVKKIERENWNLSDFPIDTEWLAFIHSLAISPDQSKLLIVSSGFDRIIETDIQTGEVTREWCAWDHGYSESKGSKSHIVSDESKVTNREGDYLVVKSAKDFGNKLGLPPNLRTAFPNSACYIDDSHIMATLFHHGLVKIDMDTGETTVIDQSLNHPHAAYFNDQRCFITNTGSAEFIEYDQNLARKRIFQFKNISEVTEEALGREWLQHVKPLGNGRYIATDSNRTSIFIIDEFQRTIRTIPFDKNWVIQETHVL